MLIITTMTMEKIVHVAVMTMTTIMIMTIIMITSIITTKKSRTTSTSGFR